MQLARMIVPITTLGPGKRVGIWVQGCSKRCKGCISKEMQTPDESKEVPIEILVDLIKSEAKRNLCNSITISGGDPFEQVNELLVLLKNIRNDFDDILVYTGYMLDEIKSSSTMNKCLKFIDVLIDGRYVEEENDGKSALRGSSNQNIIFLNPKLLSKYKDYELTGRDVETFIHNDKVIVVGIQERIKNEEGIFN